MESQPSPETTVSPPWSTTLKVVVGVVSLVLLGVAAYAFRAVFAPVAVGAIMAYVLSPVVRAISRRLPLPRGLATLLVFLLLVGSLTPIVVVVVQEVSREIVTAYEALVAYLQRLSTMSDTTITILSFQVQVGDVQQAISGALLSMLQNIAPNTVGFALGAVRSVVLAVFTLFIGFYLTRDANRVVAAIKGLAPPRYRGDFALLLAEVDRVWAAFLRGQVILALTVTVILTVLSAFLGLPQPLLLGLWGGLLEFLPSIGNMIWGATAITLAIVAGSSTLAVPPAVFVLIVAICYVVFAQIDVNVLVPNILGGQIKLHPVVVLIGVIIGLTIGGVLGVALAAPMIATLRVISRYVYAKLLDLDPFPMAGPPGGTRSEREQAAEREAAQAAAEAAIRRRRLPGIPARGRDMSME